MRCLAWIGIAWVALSSCAAPASAPADAVALWEPIDPAFAGCQGACGAHADGPEPGVIAQPGASVGQRTYCPVSGAVFEIDATHPHADVGGQSLWFCCAGCYEYFDHHRESVLGARGIPRVQPRARAEPRSAASGS